MTASALPMMMPPAVSGKKSRFVMCESNLGLMQEIVRKDPESYKEEFNEQLYFYTQTMKLLQLQPAMHKLEVQSLLDTIIFLAGVAQFYPAEAKDFSAHLQTILREQAPGLDAEVRMQFCKALVCLRNKNMVEPLEITDLFFELTKVEDKRLRKFIITSIGAHLKRLHLKKNAKALSKLQNFCLTKLKDSRSIIARVAQLILIDAFRKQYWRDAKTANAIAECCFHKLPKMQVTAMKFFLGSKEDEEGIEVDSEDDEEAAEKDAEQKTLKDIMQSYRNAKKTKKRTKDFEKAKKMLSKKRKTKKEGRSKECNLLAIQLLYDPQALSDRLFGMLEQKKIDKFEIRLFRIALIARLAGIHKLQTLGFYSYLHRYMQPRQRDVTRILLYAAQACHDLVPPDTIEQLLHCIAQEFITDRNSPEAITVGINAIREILANCPFAATEELMRDLAEYKQYKNKNVSMAARGLVALCRTLNPKLLKKKDRGRPVDGNDETAEEYRAYAAPIVRNFVPGAECLDDEQLIDEDEEKSGVGSDEEEEWEDYSESEESGVEEPPAKRKKQNEEKIEEDEEEEGDEEIEEIDNDDEELEVDEEDEEDEEMSGEEDDEDDEREIEAASPSPSTTLSTSTNAAEKAATISNDRILTQAEFKKIRHWQIKKQVLGSKRLARGGKKREHLTNDDRLIEEEVLQTFQTRDTSDGLPRLNAIEHFHKKKKETKAERLERVEEGREGREDYGKKKKNGPHVGRTNRELAKKKVFQMVRAKKRGQNRQRSFRDQQKSLRNYLLRQSGRKPGNM